MVEQGLPRFARAGRSPSRNGWPPGMLGRGCDARAVTVAILYSFPFYGAMMVAQYWMLQSVGAEVGLLAVILGAPLVSLVALTPITINGLFLAEGAFVADLRQHRASSRRWRWPRRSSAAWSTSSIPGWAASCGWPGMSASAAAGRPGGRRRADGVHAGAWVSGTAVASGAIGGGVNAMQAQDYAAELPDADFRRSHAFRRERFERLVQYVCWICEDPRALGLERLNRILWYVDRTVFLTRDRVATGATYLRHRGGPWAKPLEVGAARPGAARARGPAAARRRPRAGPAGVAGQARPRRLRPRGDQPGRGDDPRPVLRPAARRSPCATRTTRSSARPGWAR